jgi:hypothetical protein
MKKIFMLLFLLLNISSFIFADEGKQFLYISRFEIGPRGGIKQIEVEQIRSEILEKMGKQSKYQLVGPEAEDAIRKEQFKIETEGGSGMMCRAEECRRRLLRVASADALIEGTVEMLDREIAQVRLEMHSRTVSEKDGGKKEQSVRVIIQKYKVQSDSKDKLRMQSFISELLAKKISGQSVTEEEEEMASGLKPLGGSVSWSGAWRSTLIPGWGQLHKNQPIRAGIYFTLFAGAVGAFAVSNGDISSSKSDYNRSVILPLFIPYSATDTSTRLYAAYFLQNSSRPSYENAVSTTNGIAAAVAAVYVWNIFDALVFSGSSSEKKVGLFNNEDQKFSFGFSTYRNNIPAYSVSQKNIDYSFHLTWRF